VRHDRPRELTAKEFATLQVEGKTELLDGFIYDVSPRAGERHSYAAQKLVTLLTEALLPDYFAQGDHVIAVPDWNAKDAPRPDVAVFFAKRYAAPTARDIFAFLEVADSSYDRDRNYKMPLYVNAGVPAYIVNLELRQVERYASPADLELPRGTVYSLGSSFEVLGVPIAVADLFVPDDR
jgi:hypothetical protein